MNSRSARIGQKRQNRAETRCERLEKEPSGCRERFFSPVPPTSTDKSDAVSRHRPDGAGGAYKEKILHASRDGPDGIFPVGGVIFLNGSLYGMTRGAGAAPQCCGTIFETAPDGTDYQVLLGFTGTVAPSQGPCLQAHCLRRATRYMEPRSKA